MVTPMSLNNYINIILNKCLMKRNNVNILIESDNIYILSTQRTVSLHKRIISIENYYGIYVIICYYHRLNNTKIRCYYY